MSNETKYDWENPRKIKNSNNWLLNKIGNFCEFVARPLNNRYYKWGTFWTFDLKEDIDKQEANKYLGVYSDDDWDRID